MSDRDHENTYNNLDIEVMIYIAKNYTNSGEHLKARHLFEAACEINQGHNHEIIKLFAQSAYKEGNTEMFEIAVKKFTQEHFSDYEVKTLLSIYMFLNGNKKCYSLFESIKNE